jgi:GAF domain-containing protein
VNRPVRSEPGFGTSEWAFCPWAGATIGWMSSLIARLGRRVVLDSGEASPIEATAVRRVPDFAPEVDGRLRTVLAVAERLTQTFDRLEILQTISTEVNDGLGADGTTIRVLQDDQLVVAAWSGLTDADAGALPEFGRNDGAFGAVFESGLPFVAEDILENPEHAAVLARYRPAQAFRSLLVVPLMHEGDVIGAMSAVAARPRAWSEADVEFVRGLATHASIALHNATLFERTRAWAGQLAVLQTTSARMSRQNSVESVGRAIVEEVQRIIDYHNCRVYQLEEPDDLVPIAFAGGVGSYEKVEMSLLRTKLGKGFTGWAAQRGKPLLIHDAMADPRGATIPGTDDVDESMIVVPMQYDERVIGVITVSKLGLRQFDEDDLRLLMILADQAATALESARLVTRSQELATELRRILDMGAALA